MFILVIFHQLVLALHHLLEMVFGIGELGQYRAQVSVTGLQLDHSIIGGKDSNFNKDGPKPLFYLLNPHRFALHCMCR